MLRSCSTTSARLLEPSLAASEPPRMARRRSSPNASGSVRARSAATSSGCASSVIRSRRGRGVGGGYRLGAGAAVPPLLLDAEEAVAVAVGLRTCGKRRRRAGSRRPRCARWQSSNSCCRRVASPRRRARLGDCSPIPASGRASTLRCSSAIASGVPRPRAAAIRLPRSRGRAEPADRRAPPARAHRAGAGTSSRGTASARTGARSASTGSCRRCRATGASLRASRRRRDIAAYVARAIAAPRDRHQARIVLHAPLARRRRARAAPRRHARGARRASAACSRTGSDWLGGLAVVRRRDRRRLRGARAARARRAGARARRALRARGALAVTAASAAGLRRTVEGEAHPGQLLGDLPQPTGRSQVVSGGRGLHQRRTHRASPEGRRGRRRRRRGCRAVAAYSVGSPPLLGALCDEPVEHDQPSRSTREGVRRFAGWWRRSPDARRSSAARLARALPPVELQREHQVGELRLPVGGPAAGSGARSAGRRSRSGRTGARCC